MGQEPVHNAHQMTYSNGKLACRKRNAESMQSGKYKLQQQ